MLSPTPNRKRSSSVSTMESPRYTQWKNQFDEQIEGRRVEQEAMRLMCLQKAMKEKEVLITQAQAKKKINHDKACQKEKDYFYKTDDNSICIWNCINNLIDDSDSNDQYDDVEKARMRQIISDKSHDYERNAEPK